MEDDRKQRKIKKVVLGGELGLAAQHFPTVLSKTVALA